jgi:tRNA/tmRNA/rRNA uracil-C5-methylase (TrmA/RlmC/RlmD family)
MRKPVRVLHIFCGTDEIPAALAEWERYGYRVKEVLPMDLFPGTPHLETLVALERK